MIVLCRENRSDQRRAPHRKSNAVVTFEGALRMIGRRPAAGWRRKTVVGRALRLPSRALSNSHQRRQARRLPYNGNLADGVADVAHSVNQRRITDLSS